MSHRRKAPLVADVLKDGHLSRRKLAELVAIRLTYGKSTFYDPHSGTPRYPVEVIGLALVKAVRKARQCGEELELSVYELRLWGQMFPGTSNGEPDRKKRQVSA